VTFYVHHMHTEAGKSSAVFLSFFYEGKALPLIMLVWRIILAPKACAVHPFRFIDGRWTGSCPAKAESSAQPPSRPCHVSSRLHSRPCCSSAQAAADYSLRLQHTWTNQKSPPHCRLHSRPRRRHRQRVAPLSPAYRRAVAVAPAGSLSPASSPALASCWALSPSL
jgi:hypothetical protein